MLSTHHEVLGSELRTLRSALHPKLAIPDRSTEDSQTTKILDSDSIEARVTTSTVSRVMRTCFFFHAKVSGPGTLALRLVQSEVR